MRLLILCGVLVVVFSFCTTLHQYDIDGINAPIVGWVGLCFFSLGFAAILWQYFKTDPLLIIDEREIETKQSEFGVIDWSDVMSLSVVKIHKQRFLCIKVVDSKKYLDRLTAGGRVATRVNRAMGLSEITIAFAVNLSHSPEEVMAFIHEHYLPAAN